MIPAVYYKYIYILVAALFTIYVSARYSKYSWSRLSQTPDGNNVGSIVLLVLYTLFIGFRPVSKVFADTVVYARNYDYFFNESFVFEWGVEDPLFENLLTFCASRGFDVSVFFTIVAAVYFGGMFIACRKLFPRDLLFAFLVYLAAFSTFSYGVNGIRAGAAASLFLVAIAYRDKKWLSIALMAMSYGVHHSMQLLIVAYIIVSFIKNPKYYLWIWGLSFVAAALHITAFQELFAGVTDEVGARYLLADDTNETAYLTGFRLDFILYSATPIVLGYYLIFKRGLKTEKFNLIYNLYVLANSIWLLCMYASYTNRIAYLSWQLLPIVLIYPFLNDRLYPQQYKYANYIALAHLAFTLFMTFIYY